jgi:hypothetical protein
MVPEGKEPHVALKEEEYDKTVRDWIRDRFYETIVLAENFFG